MIKDNEIHTHEILVWNDFILVGDSLIAYLSENFSSYDTTTHSPKRFLGKDYSTKKIILLEIPYPVDCTCDQMIRVKAMNKTICDINNDKNIRNKVCVFSLRRFLYHNTALELEMLNSPKTIKYVKTAWSQLRGDLGTNAPWSKAAKEDIARALDKYMLFIKRGFDKQQDKVIQLIKNLKKGPKKLKTKDTTHVLSVQENMQTLI